MKNILALLPILLISILPAAAQKKVNPALLETTPVISITEEQTDHNGVVESALSSVIMADHDDFEKAWKNYFSDKYKVELKRVGDYNESATASVTDWMPGIIRIATRVIKDGDRSKVYLLAYDGSRQINSTDNADVIERMKSTMRNMIYEYYVKSYDHAIGDAQKDYDKSTKSYNKLISQGNKLSSSLSKNESSISKTNSAISENESKLKSTESKIDQLKNESKEKKEKLAEQTSKKEAKAAEVKMKQEQLNAYSSNGQLDSKDAQKVTKDLEKLRKEQSKIEAESIKISQEVSKTDEKISKETSNKQKLASKTSDLKSNENKLKSEEHKLHKSIEDNKKEAKDMKEKMDAAAAQLSKLKEAKSKLVL